jgi:hypothetical protein
MKLICLHFSLFFLLFSCKNNSLPKSDHDCIGQFGAAVMSKNFDKQKKLSSGAALDSLLILSTYSDRPYFELISPTSNGRYLPIRKNTFTKYYVAIHNDTAIDTFSISVDNVSGNGFQVVGISKIGKTKIRSIVANTDENKIVKNDYDASMSEKSDAIYKMSQIFQGNPSEDELEDKLDRCIKLYGYEPNEENYNKFGSVLVTLVESDNKIYSELQLLECIIDVRKDTPKNMNLKFASTAATCAVLMGSKTNE